MSADTELSIDVRNFPPSGSNAELRPMMFGGPGNPLALVEIVGEAEVVITLANLAENDEIADQIRAVIELLELVLGEDVEGKAAAELERMRAEGEK